MWVIVLILSLNFISSAFNDGSVIHSPIFGIDETFHEHARIYRREMGNAHGGEIVDIGKGDETLKNLIKKTFGRKYAMTIANFDKRFKEKIVGAANNKLLMISKVDANKNNKADEESKNKSRLC